MIRVLVLYPRDDSKKFDTFYYLNHHLKLVREKLAPVRLEADLGVDSSSGKPAPFYAVSHMIFNSREELNEKYSKFGKELNADKAQFTDIEIITQISEMLDLKE